jgi:hypothetical protein
VSKGRFAVSVHVFRKGKTKLKLGPQVSGVVVETKVWTAENQPVELSRKFDWI